MKHLKKARGSSLVSALLLGLASIGVARTAEASPNYPGLLQAALTKQFPTTAFCVPLCTACHVTTIGGPGMLNSFGTNLLLHGGLVQSNNGMNDGTVATSIQKWFGTPPPPGSPVNAAGEVDSDGDGIGDATELQHLDSPSVAGPRGVGQFCTDLKYGCSGGRIAAAPPPVDSAGLFSAGLVVVGFAAMRRRCRLAKRTH